MSKIDKEEETNEYIEEKNKVARKWNNLIIIEDGEGSSSPSSMSMYSIDSDQEVSQVASYHSPTLIEVHIPKKQEEVHSSPTMEKNLSERNSVIQEEENPLSYNIKEIFESFTFNLYKKEVSRKRVHNEK
jgi:hypothetical protein